MSLFRRYITLGFALVFVLSGMANAHARVMMAGAHSIEICAGFDFETITLGINGEKLPELHECDICCIAVGMLQDATSASAHSGMANLAAWRGFELALNAGDAVFSIWPRGPPVRG